MSAYAVCFYSAWFALFSACEKQHTRLEVDDEQARQKVSHSFRTKVRSALAKYEGSEGPSSVSTPSETELVNPELDIDYDVPTKKKRG